MIETLNVQDVFYRTASRQVRQNQVLNGLGSYLGKQTIGRYHTSTQRTVYAALDPVVVLTAAMFYEARVWQKVIGTTALVGQQQLPPLIRSTYRLWSFRLNAPLAAVNLDHAQAVNLFGHPPFVLHNPTADHYLPTQQLKDAVFQLPAQWPHPKAWGLKAPSVRTPSVIQGNNVYQPCQHVFILQANQTSLPATILGSWNLEVEFLDEDTDQSVTAQTIRVNWRRPQFQLQARNNAGVVAGYPPRPHVTNYDPDVAYRLDINYP